MREGIRDGTKCETRILRTTVTPLLVQEDTSLVVSEPKWSQLQELRQETCSLGVDRPANELASPIALANALTNSLRAELSRSRYREEEQPVESSIESFSRLFLVINSRCSIIPSIHVDLSLSVSLITRLFLVTV